MITKLNDWGSIENRCPLFLPFSITKKQKTKVGLHFSDFIDILFDVPQGLILVTTLFVIFIADSFFLLTKALILKVVQMILLPKFVDRIVLKL